MANRVDGWRCQRRSVAVLALATLGMLAGCANQRADSAAYAQTALIGLTKDQLLTCAGAPERSATTEAAEFLTYESEAISSSPAYGSFGFGTGFGSRRYSGVGFGFPIFGGADINRSTCRATFSLRNDVVTAITYSDPQGNSTLAQCYQIVEPCLNALSNVPPPPVRGTPTTPGGAASGLSAAPVATPSLGSSTAP